MQVMLQREGIRLRLVVPDDMAAAVDGIAHYDTAPTDTPVDSEVVVSPSADTEVRVDEHGVRLRVPPEEVTKSVLQVAVDQGFTVALDARGMSVLHAAAVYTERGVLVLWGTSGAGKTTTALTLHERYGWDVISNGSLIVGLVGGRPCAIGTAKKHVKLRASSLRKTRVRGGYEEKATVPIEQFQRYETARRLPAEITEVVFLKVVDGLSAAAKDPIDPRRAAVRLHEDLVRHLHGGESLLIGASGTVLAGMPRHSSSASAAARAALISALVERSSLLTGPLAACARELGRAEMGVRR